MNAINEDLLKSLSQDIRKISEVNDNIGTYLEDNSENSSTWLLSCKDENEIINLTKDKNSNQERYLSTLELIIDRIYLFLNSLLRFVEVGYFDEDPLGKNKYVVRPNNLTLGTTVKLLWQQLTEIKPIKSIDNVRKCEISRTNITKNSQTDTSCFDTCYTCTNVNNFVKKIVELFEIRFSVPAITQEKENIRKNIYNLTQHACVDRFLKEVERTVEDILKENDSLKSQIHNLSNEVQNKEYELLSLEREHKRSEIACGEHSENAQKEKERYDKLYQRYNGLHFRNHQLEKCLRTESEKLANTEILLSKEQENCQILETRKNQLEKELENARTTTKALYAEKDVWKKRFLDESSENQNLKKDISNTHASVVQVKAQLNKVDMDYQELNDLLTKSTFEYKNTIQRYNTILHKLKEVIASKLSNNKKQQVDSVDRGDNVNVGIKIEGNPLTDMTNQVKANEVLIEKLQEKNDHLLKVIRNLKKMEQHS